MGGVDQLITLSTPTRVEVELGLGCGWAVTIIEKYYIENLVTNLVLDFVFLAEGMILILGTKSN